MTWGTLPLRALGHYGTYTVLIMFVALITNVAHIMFVSLIVFVALTMNRGAARHKRRVLYRGGLRSVGSCATFHFVRSLFVCLRHESKRGLVNGGRQL